MWSRSLKSAWRTIGLRQRRLCPGLGRKLKPKMGFSIEVAANIGNAKDAEEAVGQGADGVGLLRSEFLFLKRREAPTEAEQAAEYTAIAKALGPKRSLVIRTLDVGGDKPLPYLPQEPEENPFLGIRGCA